jgi:hypothetical protein
MSNDRANAVRALDAQTADAWMRAQGFTSPALRWWVEYGTRDDYGSALSQSSAWAAVHYFAARDAEEIGPLTWPEGNDWTSPLVAHGSSCATRLSSCAAFCAAEGAAIR